MAAPDPTYDPTAPIPPARFAAALRDLPLTSLALKAAEIRNSIAHLEYSNIQLHPFAHPETGDSDSDCIEAIQENEVVIVRMKERISLLRVEVERRGVSWREFAGPEELEQAGNGGDDGEGEDARVNGAAGGNNGGRSEEPAANAANGTTPAAAERHSAWTDGTFQVGRISGGEVVMDGAGSAVASSTQQGPGRGGRLGDEELRRRMEERMRAAALEDDDDDEGMHL